MQGEKLGEAEFQFVWQVIYSHTISCTHTAVCDEEWSLGILGREGIINVL